MRLPNPLQVAMLLSTLTSDAPSTTEVGIALHPNGVRGKCLDVQGGKFVSGTPVQIYDCNDTAAQKWVFDSCKKTIRLADTNFCLDATTDPSNGTKMKIWQCIDNIPAQLWFRTASNQVVLFGKGK
ncbi:hypothetical protein AX14_010980 [Amanita brunnescens Koide BX004]|nr:hypothetical protein AX14_010980 [Amanita brunnescens Koide BX004]